VANGGQGMRHALFCTGVPCGKETWTGPVFYVDDTLSTIDGGIAPTYPVFQWPVG
jgi:hypothetical protein